jgi:hypothetical protein
MVIQIKWAITLISNGLQYKFLCVLAFNNELQIAIAWSSQKVDEFFFLCLTFFLSCKIITTLNLECKC